MSKDAVKRGRKRKSTDGRAYVTLRMDPELLKRIDAECTHRVVSRTHLVERVMTDWLSQHGEAG